MKRYGILLLSAIVILILQQAIFSRLSILNVSFDAVFIFIICFSLLGDEIESLVIALFCGIIRDSFFPLAFGINTVIYIFTAYILSQMAKRIFRELAVIPVLLTFVFTILKGLLLYGYFYIISVNFKFADYVVNTTLIEAVYNSIICILLCRIVKKINSFSLIKRSWKF